MEDNQRVSNASVTQSALPALPPPGQTTATPEEKGSRAGMIIAGLVALAIIGALVFLFYFLATTNADTTSQIRDVFIIFMALESIVIGVALVILIVQLAILINLIQNELKPILSSTNETVNTLRGTVNFLSDNLVEPVIKLNATIAGAKKLFDLLRPDRW